jgi:hypothetical protein
MARSTKAKKTVDVEKSTVTFDGGTHGTFVADLSKLKPEIVHRLALHGLSQKLGDSYAGDVENPVHEARGVYDELAAGNWSTRVAGEPRFTLLAEAIAAIKGVAVDVVQSKLEEMDEDEVAALKKNPAVKARMDHIKAQRAIERAKATAANAAGATLDLDI